MPCLYLIHIWPAYHHARHYLGWTADSTPYARLATHVHGWGSPLLDAALDAGHRLLLADVWPGTRVEERRLKRHSHVNHWCPLCQSVTALDRALRTGGSDVVQLLAARALRPGGVVPR